MRIWAFWGLLAGFYCPLVPADAQDSGCTKVPSAFLSASQAKAIIDAGQKGEYETTQAVEARLANIAPSGQVFFSVPNSKVVTKYDADTQTLSVGKFSFPPATTTLRARKDRELIYYNGFELSHEAREGGSYVGQNAFGAVANVERLEASSIVVAWLDDGPTLRPADEIFLHISPSDAPAARENLGIFIAGKLQKPFVLKDETFSAATIDDPVSYTSHNEAVIFEPECAAVYDIATGKIYWSWGATRAP